MSIIETAEIDQRKADILDNILEDFSKLLDKMASCSDIPDDMFGEIDGYFEELSKYQHERYIKFNLMEVKETEDG
tara:strand:- start:2189 stop:2413 length:225 start_codon:yes stop_codon:yes gene_type:complete